ncbi:MAG: hypothetical protein AAB368_08185, partial [bacterium]
GSVFLSETNTGGLAHTVAGAAHVWTGALTLLPGDSVTVTIAAQATCAGTTAQHYAAAYGIHACGIALDNNAKAGDAVTVAGPAIAVTAAKSPASLRLTPGQPFTFAITVRNTGGATLETLTVVDTVQSPLVATGTAQPAGFAAPPKVSLGAFGVRYEWSRTGLGMVPGAEYTFTITGVAGATAAAVTLHLPALAVAGTACAAVSIPTNDAVVVVAPAGEGHLVVTLAVTPDPAHVGNTLSVVCTVRNDGSSAVTGVLPVLTPGVGASRIGPLNGPLPAGAVTLAPGASASFTWNCGAVALGVVKFNAMAAGVSADTGNPVSGAAAAQVVIEPVGGPPDGRGWVYIIGGRRGYVSVREGETAEIVVRCPRSGRI